MNYDKLADELVAWMRTFAEKAGATGYVIGLSGGIDSSVSAALAVRAVGIENVVSVLLPCHSQPEDAKFARMVADALALSPETVDLSETYDLFLKALPPGNEMARANLKPRLRMASLYYLAQSHNALVLGTGNRPEIMVGYFTKYGDGGVDLEPLGELYKHEVRELARVLGIPEPVITRPPTAGLWPGQTDESELGLSYDQLDAILAAWAEGRVPDAPERVIARVEKLVASSAHKRAVPPVYPVVRG